MRTGTGMRRVGGHLYCDEPGCPADGFAIDPDEHEHGKMSGTVACGGRVHERVQSDPADSDIEQVTPDAPAE
jgi:hypothetical protein